MMIITLLLSLHGGRLVHVVDAHLVVDVAQPFEHVVELMGDVLLHSLGDQQLVCCLVALEADHQLVLWVRGQVRGHVEGCTATGNKGKVSLSFLCDLNLQLCVQG